MTNQEYTGLGIEVDKSEATQWWGQQFYPPYKPRFFEDSEIAKEFEMQEPEIKLPKTKYSRPKLNYQLIISRKIIRIKNSLTKLLFD